ncbi:thyrostimulin beta-5 subunit [Planococcus citri]|uniref:thyrostimulin beta-5 subunit n=1 Tax=Planococcus citri TaxID=170843 RepID=UPI0031FA0237
MLKVLIAVICLVALNNADVDPESTLSCHRRIYYHNMTKKDTFGRMCWDVIPMLSCWGRCDSNEIPDWKFPFKKSHHPVCLHDLTEQSKVILKNCDDGIEPGTDIFEFIQAVTCRCSTCKSSTTSCESVLHRDHKFHPNLEID